jgi:hypothetical protein
LCELGKAIETVADLVRRYTSLFTAASIGRIEPAIPASWKRPFHTPLFERPRRE